MPVHIRRLLSLALVAVASFQCHGPRPTTQVADLIAQFGQAGKQPSDAAFQIADVTLDGSTRRSIVAQDQTRMTHHVTIPKHAVLRTAVAVHPSTWHDAGGGILFMVGISDGNWYQTKASVIVDPSRAADRQWHHIAVNLEEFAGLTVDIVLNTRTGATGPSATGRQSLAVWGTPVVMLQ